MPDIVRVGTVRQFLGSPGDVLYQVGLFGEDGTEVGLVYDGRCRCCAGQSCLHSRTVERVQEPSGALAHDDGPGPRSSLRSVMVRATVVPGTRQWLACTLHALRTTCHVLHTHTAVSSVAAEGRCSWDTCTSRLLTFLNNIPGTTRSGYRGS